MKPLTALSSLPLWYRKRLRPSGLRISGRGGKTPDGRRRHWTFQTWLVQYFTATGGHSLIVLVHDQDTDKILTLESNSYYNIDGAGWGGIGNLRDVPNPGPDWKDKTNQTWKSRIESKLAVHAVRLNVDSDSIRAWLKSKDESWKS